MTYATQLSPERWFPRINAWPSRRNSSAFISRCNWNRSFTASPSGWPRTTTADTGSSGRCPTAASTWHRPAIGSTTSSADNCFEGDLSADALGITSCLYAYSHLSFTDGDIAREYARHYHRLRAFMAEHPEVGSHPGGDRLR